MSMKKSEIVRQLAKGRWLEIITALEPAFKDAADNVGHHTACPVYGGKDGFRFMDDANDTGSAYSNKDGFIKNGFETLMWKSNESFSFILNLVWDYLDVSLSFLVSTLSIVPLLGEISPVLFTTSHHMCFNYKYQCYFSLSFPEPHQTESGIAQSPVQWSQTLGL